MYIRWPYWEIIQQTNASYNNNKHSVMQRPFSELFKCQSEDRISSHLKTSTGVQSTDYSAFSRSFYCRPTIEIFAILPKINTRERIEAVILKYFSIWL